MDVLAKKDPVAFLLNAIATTDELAVEKFVENGADLGPVGASYQFADYEDGMPVLKAMVVLGPTKIVTNLTAMTAGKKVYREGGEPAKIAQLSGRNEFQGLTVDLYRSGLLRVNNVALFEKAYKAPFPGTEVEPEGEPVLA